MILTAAHCVKYTWGGVVPPYTIKIVAGQVNLDKKEHSIERIASKVHAHEGFDYDSFANDIAIIEVRVKKYSAIFKF